MVPSISWTHIIIVALVGAGLYYIPFFENCGSSGCIDNSHNKQAVTTPQVIIPIIDFSTNNSTSPQLSLSSAFEFPCVAHNYPHRFLINAHIEAPNYKSEDRAPMDIVAVIDNSGSMEGQKLKLVEQALGKMVSSMSSHDRLSIVTFNYEARVILSGVTLDAAGKALALDELFWITAGGGTHLSAGLRVGMELFHTLPPTHGIKSLLLFTDGMATHGARTSSEISQILQSLNNQYDITTDNNRNMYASTIHTFGFGADHDSKFLSDIAQLGLGMYYYIENATRIAPSFANCFGGLLSTFAQDLVLSFDPASEVKVMEVKTAFGVQFDESRKGGVVKLNDIQSEEQRDILFVVDLSTMENPSDNVVLMNLTLNYTNSLTNKQEVVTHTLVINRPRDCGTVQRDTQIDKQINRLLFIEALTSANKAASQSDMGASRKIIDDTIEQIKKSAQIGDYDVDEIINDLERSKDGLQDEQSYKQYGMKQMESNIMSHSTQRSTLDDWGSQGEYLTSSRESAIMMFTSDGDSDSEETN